jgi:hypothetical protein
MVYEHVYGLPAEPLSGQNEPLLAALPVMVCGLDRGIGDRKRGILGDVQSVEELGNLLGAGRVLLPPGKAELPPLGVVHGDLPLVRSFPA